MSKLLAPAALRAAGLAARWLGWRPADFWSATPAELAAALAGLTGGEAAEAPLSEGALSQLMEQFPDG